MGVIRWAAAAIAATLALHAHAAGEDARVREQIRADVQRLFAAHDYKQLDERYAKALASDARTPSGHPVTDIIRTSLSDGPRTETAVPGADDYWVPREEALKSWTRQFPQSTLAAIALARTYVGHGWSWRGSGYARDVSQEGFRKLAEYSQRAYETLLAREASGRNDPLWYAQMIFTSRMQGWPRERFVQLTGEATQAFPRSQNIYLAAANRLLPQWGGSPEAFAGFLDYAVQRSRATDGESMYAILYLELAEQMHLELSGPDSPWPRIRAGFDDLVKRYPDSWNLNRYAAWACDARDIETARKVLVRIKDDVDPAAWPARANYVRCMQAAGLRSSAP